jgi:hypothetical protein
MARPSQQEIIVKLTLKNKELQRKLKETRKKTEDESNKMAGSFGALATKVALVTAAVVATGVAMERALRPAIEWQDAQVRMGVIAQGNVQVLGEMSAIVDANAGGMFKRADIAAALNYAGAVGFNIEQTKRLLPLLRDVAAVYGEDITVALQAVVRAALFGEAELAERIGLTLREGAILDVTDRLFGKRLSQLNKEQKIIAIVTAAEEQLMRIRGGEAKASDTLSGATKNLTTALTELTADALEPSLGPLAQFANLLAEAAKEARNLRAEARKIGEEEDIEKLADAIERRLGSRAGLNVPRDPRARQAVGAAGATAQRNRRMALERILANIPEGEFFGAGIGVVGLPEPPPPIPGIPTAEAAEAQTNAVLEQIERLDQTIGDPIAEEKERADARLAVFRDLNEGKIESEIERVDTTESLNRRIIESNQAVAASEEEANIRREQSVNEYIRTATVGVQMVSGATETMFAGLISGEVNTAKKRKALVAAGAKGFVASGLRAISQVAAQSAVLAGARALEQAGWALGPFGAPTSFKAAAAYAALAGVTAVTASALQASADREFELATGGQDRPGAGRGRGGAGRAVGDSATRRAIRAQVARGPETVNISVSTVIEGNVFTGEEGAEAIYNEFIRENIQADLLTKEIEAVA